VLGTVVVADSTLDTRAVAVVVTLGMWSLAGLVTRLTVATELRPVDESLIDVVGAALEHRGRGHVRNRSQVPAAEPVRRSTGRIRSWHNSTPGCPQLAAGVERRPAE
jgi:hypothetical protein